MNSSKYNPALIIGIALPFIFIAILVAVLVIPTLSLKPAHNFLYTTDIYNNYSGFDPIYKNKIVVKNGHIVLEPVVAVRPTAPGAPKVVMPVANTEAPTLYLYDVSSQSSHEISLADAELLSVVAGPSSPDGYTVEYKYNSGGIFDLFGGERNGQGFFVSKGDSSRRLSGLSTSMYSYNFNLVAWVQ